MKYFIPGILGLLFLIGGSLFSAVIAQNAPPTANCKGNAVATPIFNGETRSIHARVFDQNSYDDKTASKDLRFAYSSDPADSLLIIDCNSVDSFEVTMYVFDEENAYDFCTARLNIDDQCENSPIINGTTDTIAPTVYLVDEIALVTLDSVSFNTIEARDFDAGTTDNVSSRTKLQFSFSPDPTDTKFSYHCDDYPGFELVIYVTDEAGNQAYCRTSFGIDTSNCNDGFIVDTIPPVALCISSIDADLDVEGVAMINASDINEGSYDGDFTTPEDRLTFGFNLNDKSVTELVVDCGDLGESERTLYVWDHAGNVDSCVFTLNVFDPLEICAVDTIPPTAKCVPLLEISFEGDTIYTLSAIELDDGSSDDETPTGELFFSFSADTLDNSVDLSCKDLGNNQITLFVTDQAGNTATCVSVVDLSDPEGVCRDTTTSVSNLDYVQWNIYPNPFSTTFTIDDLPVEEGTIQLTIYDMGGTLIYEKEIQHSPATVQPDLMGGNYVLKLSQKGKVIGVHKLFRH